jgi:hypothetical protein
MAGCLDFRRLRYFVAVCELGGFRALFKALFESIEEDQIQRGVIAGA